MRRRENSIRDRCFVLKRLQRPLPPASLHTYPHTARGSIQPADADGVFQRERNRAEVFHPPVSTSDQQAHAFFFRGHACRELSFVIGSLVQ